MKHFMFVVFCLMVAGSAQAEKSKAELIAEAESSAPPSVSKNAAIKIMSGA